MRKKNVFPLCNTKHISNYFKSTNSQQNITLILNIYYVGMISLDLSHLLGKPREFLKALQRMLKQQYCHFYSFSPKF